MLVEIHCVEKHSFDAAELSSKGCTVNRYQKETVKDDSVSLGLAYTFSPKFNLDINWQGFGEVKSALDIKLPAGKTTRQAVMMKRLISEIV